MCDGHIAAMEEQLATVPIANKPVALPVEDLHHSTGHAPPVSDRRATLPATVSRRVQRGRMRRRSGEAFNVAVALVRSRVFSMIVPH